MRGLATLLNPNQSGLKIYTRNHSLLGTVPRCWLQVRPMGVGIAHTEDTRGGWTLSWVNHYQLTTARCLEAKAGELHPGNPPLMLPPHPTRCIYQSAPGFEHANPARFPFLAGTGPMGSRQWHAWLVSRPGAGQEEAGPESLSEEHLNGQRRKPPSHCCGTL